MSNFYIPLSEIYIEAGEDGRIRDKKNYEVAKKVKSLLRFGQLQAILVEKLDRERWPDATDEQKWKLTDGGRRTLAMQLLTAKALTDEDTKTALEGKNIRLGSIMATTMDTQNPLEARMKEYHANHDRKGFDWKETAKYVRLMHEGLTEQNEDWTVEHTAEFIDFTAGHVYDYLRITKDEEVFENEKVQTAKTFRTARKQARIQRDIKRRIKMQELEVKEVERKKKEGVDYLEIAKGIVHHGDCRDWIKGIPDNSLAWFHWDPPYGGREGGGGAFASHEEVDIDPEYCIQLMSDMIPEIWRVLHDGAWLVMWYTPVFYHWLRLTLQGHRFDEGGTCQHCSKHLAKDHIWLSGNYSCRKSPHRFWVNPFPNYWLKTGRKADGHEIQRFFTKQTEPFLLAGKNLDRMPILIRSDRGNVFDYPGIERSERRHVNHKPPKLLSEILSCISVSGELGGDAGAGSGSIIEAAFGVGRKVITAELREGYRAISIDVAAEVLRDRQVTHLGKIADWLVV